MLNSREDFKRNNVLSFMTYMAFPSTRTPAQGVLKFRYLIDLPNLYPILSFPDLWPGVEKSFEEINQFYTFTPKLSPLGIGSHEIYNLLSPFLTDAT